MCSVLYWISYIAISQQHVLTPRRIFFFLILYLIIFMTCWSASFQHSLCATITAVLSTCRYKQTELRGEQSLISSPALLSLSTSKRYASAVMNL